ncbi:hypothetical protein [uncultured Jatrophihabitans sp.]|uniref:hypothetical protein n=1 Tax=uncultured Jatrophihabitans sp. TaxID=1610747 RepID=UPI0035CA27D5
MGESAQPNRRTRRRRGAGEQGDAAPTAPGVAAGDRAVAPRRGERAARRRAGGRSAGGERALRDLAGAGSSQLGVQGALRARDVNRPSTDDLAEAERDVQIVRRNWRPDDAR